MNSHCSILVGFLSFVGKHLFWDERRSSMCVQSRRVIANCSFAFNGCEQSGNFFMFSCCCCWWWCGEERIHFVRCYLHTRCFRKGKTFQRIFGRRECQISYLKYFKWHKWKNKTIKTINFLLCTKQLRKDKKF